MSKRKIERDQYFILLSGKRGSFWLDAKVCLRGLVMVSTFFLGWFQDWDNFCRPRSVLCLHTAEFLSHGTYWNWFSNSFLGVNNCLILWMFDLGKRSDYLSFVFTLHCCWSWVRISLNSFVVRESSLLRVSKLSFKLSFSTESFSMSEVLFSTSCSNFSLMKKKAFFIFIWEKTNAISSKNKKLSSPVDICAGL